MFLSTLRIEPTKSGVSSSSFDSLEKKINNNFL